MVSNNTVENDSVIIEETCANLSGKGRLSSLGESKKGGVNIAKRTKRIQEPLLPLGKCV